MKVLINISEQKYKWTCENPLVYDSDLEISVRKGIAIPQNATNGDMIKALFPNIDTEQIEDIIDVYGMSKCRVTYDTDWWNAPYKAESEK